MKGSKKFWTIVGIIAIIYGNYLCFFTDFIPKGDTCIEPLNFMVALAVVLADIVIIIVILVTFFADILPKFNNWLDEKF